MAVITFELTSVESKERFREIAEAVLSTHDVMNDRVLSCLEEKGRALNVHAGDFNHILLTLIHCFGGLGFSIKTEGPDDLAVICRSCGVSGNHVSLVCSSCASPLLTTDRLQQNNLSGFTCPFTGMEFIFVEGGSFQMGDMFGDGQDSEKPAHEVTVGDFLLGKYPVTIKEYKAFVSETNAHYPEWLTEISRYHLKTGSNDCYVNIGLSLERLSLPMVGISWHDAVAFAEWLSTKIKRLVRLPTEAEWEYAARSRGRIERWSGTNDVNDLTCFSWFSVNSQFKLHPVGAKTPNSLGLHDMSGNVWEWCSDWYGEDYYKSSPVVNPTGPDTGRYRVLRGGAWDCVAEKSRSSCRASGHPARGSGTDGFRLAISVT